MRWKNLPRSRNVEDRRHQRTSGGGRRGTGLLGMGGMGIIIAIVIGFIAGPEAAFNALLGGGGAQGLGGGAPQTQTVGQDIDDEAEEMVKAVLGSTEVLWNQEFQKAGRQYKAPKLVLYKGMTQMPGGVAQAAMGPFYYPADETIYIDLSFYDELATKFGAPGDFAQAYVLAHEVGHHVQHLLGLTDKVHSQRGRVSQTEYNQSSVRLELQADYLAGLWADRAQENFKILERGDLEEALRAATAIGDDRLQKQSTGRVVPDSFTHGTSEQRLRWFKAGFQDGTLEGAMQAFQLPYNRL